MKISELTEHQKIWEDDRRINNGLWNARRIRDEVDELEVEKDPYLAAIEALDVIIIAAGGLAKALEAAGVPLTEADKLLEAKLQVNSTKYPKERFDSMTTEEAIAYSRFVWSFNPPEWGGNDTY